MQHCWHNEFAWLPAAVIQQDVVASIEAGLSQVLILLLEHMHTPREFTILLQDRWFDVRMAPETFFIADHDAQRMVYTAKGSAGIKPCLFCSNVVKKGLSVPGFIDICFAACKKDMQSIRDQEYFDSIEDMRRPHTKAALKEKEICYGLRLEERGLMCSAQWREVMPPSRACNVATHAYFCSGGIVQFEMMLFLQTLTTQTSMTHEDLRTFASSHGWQRGPRAGSTRSAALFRACYFDGDYYRGDACQTKSLLPLLAYYAWELLGVRGLAPEECRCLYLLLDCVTEIRRLEQRWRPLAAREEVEALERAQELHQVAFRRTYGETHMRPKHHHRLHLGECALKLGRLLATEILEKKHQAVKSCGLLTRQRPKLCNSDHLQSWLLPRLLQDTVEGSKRASALGVWGAAGPQSEADLETQTVLRDKSAQQVSTMHLRQHTFSVADILLSAGGQACLARALYHGDQCGLVARVELLRPLARMPWGSEWSRTNTHSFCRFSVEDGCYKPSWWLFLPSKTNADTAERIRILL